MPEPVLTTCPVCGSARRADARFCAVCGSPYERGSTLPPTIALSSGGYDAKTTMVAVPSRSRFVEALGLIGLVVIGIPFLILWFVVIRDDVPGFPTVVDFKISLATFVGIMAIFQGLSAAAFYGWLKVPWPPHQAAAFMHRWSGRVLIPAALVVTGYCVKDIGPQTSPTRAAIHTVLGSMVFVILVAKLIVLRFIPRLGGLLPVLGLLVVLSFVGLWFTSAFFALRASARGYGSTNVGGQVGIITDPQTVGRFDPSEVRVKVGQTVVWVNRDTVPHTVVADRGAKFDSSIISPGGGFRWQAKTGGTVTYRCTIHPQMVGGSIIVED